MGPLLKDLKFGARALLKRPGSTVLSVIAFGLGIGLTTTMFSIIYGVYFRGIGVPEADRLTVVHRTNLSEDIQRMGVDQHDFYDWREQQQSFIGLAGFSTGTINVSGTEGPERFDGAFVSANLFDVLMVAPVIGTTFREGDDAAGAPLTAVIGYDVWQTRYNGDPGVVGSTAKVNGEQATILGVMADGFQFPAEEEIWIPRRDVRSENPKRGDGPWFSVMGRLKDGVTLDQAGQDMALIAQRLAQEYTESNEGVGVAFIGFVEQAIGNDINPIFAAMEIATIFVLLIACANVANLLLARAALRTKEAAVRSAIGASRLRVAFPFFSEAIVLSGAGALLGIGIAKVGVSLFDRATTGIGKPYFMEFAIDLPILGYVLGVTVLTAIVSGAAPAYQIAKADVNSILKDENRGSSSMHAGKVSKVLVVGQVAMSCALLVGAGLMTKSITKLRNYQFNFETENLFTARLGLFESDYPTAEDRQRVFRDLKQRLEAVPRAQSVTLSDALPTWGTQNPRFAIQGETYETDQDYPRARMVAITPDYFETFDVDVARGRDFTEQDVSGAPDVALVNQRFAEKFFPGGDPIGRQIRQGTAESEEPWLTIMGVVPNMKIEGFQSPPEDSAGFYVPLLQADRRFVSIAIQAAGGNAMALTPEVRNAVRAVDPDLPIYWVRDMSEVIHQQTWFYNVFGTLFIVFGVAALFLASVGLYGVLAFSVSRRIQEMGIRMALGANARDVLRLIVREGGIQLAVGLTLGLGLALGVSNVVQIIMFDVEPRDPTVFGTIVFVISAVGVLASLVPARRATKVDPMVALRYE
jgi:predicted permease